jgi:ribosomal protein S18 acetylase RimI-like enzyme
VDGRVRASGDAGEALAEAGEFLRSRPVDHNLVLSLLDARARRAEPGRYWWSIDERGDVNGVLFQSPPTFHATLTPAPPDAVDALVIAAAADRPDLPGVSGEVAAAARFAGAWAACRKAPARPREGQRLYELGTLVPPATVPGRLRLSRLDDQRLLSRWMEGFAADTGMPVHGLEASVAARIAAGRSWIWEDAEGVPVSSAIATDPIAGVSRVGAVYTPPDQRGHGYAAACVAEVSAHVVNTDRAVAILYTQLDNPTSNAIYQRLGYRAVGEILRYSFG